MTDLDRLLELAEKAKHEAESGVFGASRQGELAIACDPDSIIGLIERVKEAEKKAEQLERAIALSLKVNRGLEARLRAAEEVVEAAREILRELDANNWRSSAAKEGREALRRYDKEKA